MYKINLIKLLDLVETEEHDKIEAKELANKILKENFWTVPVVIEVNTNAIMDGHHRLEAAKIMGLSKIPCIKLDYNSNYVRVLSWKTNKTIHINKIMKIIKEGKKFPLKTTRHIFNPAIKEINIPIELLY